MKMPLYETMIVPTAEVARRARPADNARRGGRERMWLHTARTVQDEADAVGSADTVRGVMIGLPVGLVMWVGLVWGAVSLIHLV